MKVVSSLKNIKKRNRFNQLVRRRRKIFIINKQIKKFKAVQK